MRSVATGRWYPRTIICAMYRLSRSTWYVTAGPSTTEKPVLLVRRGPRSPWSDEEVLVLIRKVLLESPFHGEGYRKVRARLRARGIGVGRNRVLRIMQKNQFLARVRRLANQGDCSHRGRIQTDRSNELLGGGCHVALQARRWLVLVLRSDRSLQ
jgi:hypothetical protein